MTENDLDILNRAAETRERKEYWSDRRDLLSLIWGIWFIPMFLGTVVVSIVFEQAVTLKICLLLSMATGHGCVRGLYGVCLL